MEHTYFIRGESTCTASTAMCAKKSESPPVIFEDMDVLAAFRRVSLPRLDVGMASFSSMYLQACRMWEVVTHGTPFQNNQSSGIHAGPEGMVSQSHLAHG